LETNLSGRCALADELDLDGSGTTLGSIRGSETPTKAEDESCGSANTRIYCDV
jgi:hypothetical protein